MRYVIINDNELYHHGIKGQRWGVRRYQNEDGSLTAAGQKRYSDREAKDREFAKKHFGISDQEYDKAMQEVNRKQQEKADWKSLSRKQKKEVNRLRKEQETLAWKKASEEYNKATDYADKHGLDYDDIIDKRDRATFIKKSKKMGDWEKIGKHIIEYNRLNDVASLKEDRYSKAAADFVRNKISEMAKSNRDEHQSKYAPSFEEKIR